ncbi:MAG: arginine--tRNA ligase [Thermoprotei archaeon]
MSSRVLEYGFIPECLRRALVESISSVLGIDGNTVEKYFSEMKLKITKTPSPEYGDYGVALHSLFHIHNISRDKWEETANKISKVIEEKGYYSECHIKEIRYVNGYLNFYINYNGLLREIIESIAEGSLFKELHSIGKGEKVIVEHTSANPIHPLHIGSGRNAVIGNTFARLLRYLGFNVAEHFYVNDMGRQVAILVYGYRIVSEKGVKPPENIKIDHWFGAIYALTNILIGINKLTKTRRELEERLYVLVDEFYGELEKLTSKYKLYSLLDLLILVNRVKQELKGIHNTSELLKLLSKRVREVLDVLGDEYIHARNTIESYRDRVLELEKEIREIEEELHEHFQALDRLAGLYPELYSVLRDDIRDAERAEEEINRLMILYESDEESVSKLFQSVTNQVLEGIRETLSNLGIVFDSFDWESGDPGRKYLDEVLSRAESLPYSTVEGRALIVDLDKAANDNEYIRKLFEPDQPGRVVLRRSDGTTLYTSRDIAYSIYKFRDLKANRVYNVIATEQTREQKQVKALLYLLGYEKCAENLIHFYYEFVNLKGSRMSSRYGQYYTLDELLEDYTDVVAHKYVLNKVKLGVKDIEGDYTELKRAFRELGIACTRALLLSVDPRKVLVFDPRKIEEYDIGAWIVYTFVRLQSILRKAYEVEPLDNIEYYINKLSELSGEISWDNVVLNEEEKSIVETLAGFKNALLRAYHNMEPNRILEYTQELCMALNKLYEKHPILREEDKAKRSIRLALVISSLTILRDLLWIMGFPLVKKL